MKRNLFILLIAAMALVAWGCEKEEFASPAVYGKITFSPAKPYVGDTVIMTVQVLDAGNRIYHADYTWKCGSVFSGQVVKVTAPDGSKTITAPPTFKYVFRESGSFDVSMNAKFKYSMSDVNGALYGVASSKVSRLEIRDKPNN